jgi:hypothetical protein
LVGVRGIGPTELSRFNTTNPTTTNIVAIKPHFIRNSAHSLLPDIALYEEIEKMIITIAGKIEYCMV